MRITLCLIMGLALATTSFGCNSECGCELVENALSGSEDEKLETLYMIATDKLIIARTGCKGGKSVDTCLEQSLARLLSDDSQDVRHSALFAAGERGFPSFTSTAEKWFTSDDEGNAVEGAAYLAAIDPEAFDARVGEALASPYPRVRSVGADRVAKTGQEKHGPAVVSAFLGASTLADGSDVFEQRAALVKLPSKYMKAAIEKAGAAHLELLIEELRALDAPELTAAALTRASGENLASLVRGADKKHLLPLVPELLKKLSDKRARMGVVERLGDLGDQAAIPALLELFSTFTPGVRIKDADGIETTDGSYEILGALLSLGDQAAIKKARNQVVDWTKRGPKEERDAATRILSSFDKDLARIKSRAAP